MTGNYSRRKMLQQSSAAITGLTTLSTGSVAGSKPVNDQERAEYEYRIPYDLSIYNNGTQEHEVRLRIGKSGFTEELMTDAYVLRGLNMANAVAPKEAMHKTELPNSGAGRHVVEVALENGQSDDGTIRLNGGVPDEMAIVVRVNADNTVTVDTIVE